MQVINTIREMKEARLKLDTVGFVPTMGYLHEGHLSLTRRAKADNDIAVVSVFVNPTQFGPNEDFGKYPRDIKYDLSMLEKEKTDIVFFPTTTEIYPPGFDTWVEVDKLARRLEGAARPGHFRGVATVVNKLLNIVQPTRAYFGQKDAQQCLVVKKMVADLNMNLGVVILPTVREPDGLAMSSRNVYLNPEQRKAAVVLSQSLKLAQELYAHGDTDANAIRQKMTELIKKESLANLEYISIASNETLEELDKIKPPALISMVVRFGRTRLLDNTILE